MAAHDQGERFVQVEEGEWYGINRKELYRCCHCDLIHRVEYRLRGNKIEARFFVDMPRTRAARRRTGVKVIKKRAARQRP